MELYLRGNIKALLIESNLKKSLGDPKRLAIIWNLIKATSKYWYKNSERLYISVNQNLVGVSLRHECHVNKGVQAIVDATMVGSIVIVGTLISCALLLLVCDLKAAKINIQHKLISELYELELGLGLVWFPSLMAYQPSRVI